MAPLTLIMIAPPFAAASAVEEDILLALAPPDVPSK